MQIKIGTRGSKLALVQTEYVRQKLQEKYPENEYEIVVIKTTGDIDLTRPLDAIGSKGIFVDEIEKALKDDSIQIAVHSMKDMPDTPTEGLTFAKAWTREDPRDVIIFKDKHSIEELPLGAKVATGSKRRSFQLLKIRPDLQIMPIRGNIDTRIRKLHENQGEEALDAIILAAAGLNRLGISGESTYCFSEDELIPAPAQGTLAIEVASDNKLVLDMVNSLSDDYTEECTYLERGFLKEIGGDCHLPVGAYACKDSKGYCLRALFGNEDGTKLATTCVHGDKADFELISAAVLDINRQLED